MNMYANTVIKYNNLQYNLLCSYNNLEYSSLRNKGPNIIFRDLDKKKEK